MEEEEKLLPAGETLHSVRRRSSNAHRRCAYITVGLYGIALHVALIVLLLSKSNRFMDGINWGTKARLQVLRTQLDRSTSTEHATNFTDYTAFSGPPNKANHDAWKGLLHNLYFNATKEEVDMEGGDTQMSIQVKGGGYLAALGVHHELHCLNKMRFFLYSHKTQKTWEEEDMAYWYRHIDHCVEVLRLSVMCTGDLSLYTFTWPKDKNSEFLDLHSRSKRQCADWNEIQEWSEDKRTSMDKGLLVPEETLH